jgi:hypothetical protein
MKLTFRAATTADAFAMSLRKEDLHEALLWAPGLDPAQAVAHSIASTKGAVAALEGDAVIAIFGISEGAHTLHPWLMCSSRIQRHAKQVIKTARALLWLKLRSGRLMCNYVAADNAAAKSFLKHLGFVIVPSPGHDKFDFFFHPQSCA